ncbi:melatonin receptor type 1A-like isoform X1 [Montipora capricornis]|uniref:melatonin receptor type 1A-like isoform X1 n=2 Tax=Montipora capricornis TaxID=246305 RepID=UPI0035F2067F
MTNISHSGFSGDIKDPKWIGILEAVILTFIMMLAILGNLLVIAVIYRRQELRRTETHIFMVNLSITDISVALLCMPFSIITAVTQEWVFSYALCQLNGFLNVFFLLTSILTLTAISIQKYVGVVQSTTRKIFTRKKTILAVGWVWFQAFMTALTPILGWNSYEYIPGRTQCSVKVPRDNDVPELANCLFIIVCGFVIPLGIMNFSYLKIFQTVKIHTRRVRSHSFSCKEKSAFLNERRITITLFIILAVFLACWTPFSVLTMYATVVGKELPKHFAVGAYWLGFLNSAMNPIIYALRTTEFRSGYRQIIGIILPCFFSRVECGDLDSAATLRSRKSFRSEVQMSLRQRRQTLRESDNIMENDGHSTGIQCENGQEQKEAISFMVRMENRNTMLESSNESLHSGRKIEDKNNGDMLEEKEFIKGGKINKKREVLGYEKKQGKAKFAEKVNGKLFSDDNGNSQGHLSPRKQSFRSSYSRSFSGTDMKVLKGFPKNRGKSTSFFSRNNEELKAKDRLPRSKSDGSRAVKTLTEQSGTSCTNVYSTRQTSKPWLQENSFHPKKISSIEILEITENP